MIYHHIPVLKREVIKYLQPKPGQNFIDCTLGAGGHAMELAKRVGPKGKVLGIDLDKEAIEFVKSKKIPNLILVNDNYKNLIKIKNEQFNYPISGILLDLGFSSAQLQTSSKGFSFQKEEDLNMRYGTGSRMSDVGSRKVLTASEIVNNWSQDELTRIFKQYGEEPNAKKIAQAIVRQRKIKSINTTFELSKIVNNIVGQFNKKTKKPHSAKGWGQPRITPVSRGIRSTHPATRVFQALRIAVNNELENLKQTLPQALKVLEPGARLAIISFHSLEDRIVKNFFKQESKPCLCPPGFPICQCNHKAALKIITKKPVIPTASEVQANPRSRSAKLRVAQKIY